MVQVGLFTCSMTTQPSSWNFRNFLNNSSTDAVTDVINIFIIPLISPTRHLSQIRNYKILSDSWRKSNPRPHFV